MSLLKRPPPLTGWGPPQCEAHWAGDTKKCCPLPSVAPRARGPAQEEAGGGGRGAGRRLAGSPSSPPPRAPPSSLAQSCLRGRRFPAEPRAPLCTHPCLLQLPPWKLQGRPGEWPSPNVPQAGPGAGGRALRSGRGRQAPEAEGRGLGEGQDCAFPKRGADPLAVASSFL